MTSSPAGSNGLLTTPFPSYLSVIAGRLDDERAARYRDTL
jgi:hypothetical protein